MISAQSFFDTMHKLEAQSPRPENVTDWLDIAHGLRAWPQRERWHVGTKQGRVYLATEVGKNGSGWFDLRWCIAAELLDPAAVADARARVGARVVSMADVIVEKCRTCGQPALVVGRDSGSNDAAGDPVCTTEVLLLCIAEPHVTAVTSNTSYDWCSV